MRLREDCRITGLRGRFLLVIPGEHGERTLEVNESFSQTWAAFAAKEFTREDISAYLEKEYGMDSATASAEASDITGLWEKYGLIKQ
ncbi:MAG: hypothetical protein J6Z20_05875 [Bacteroidales bacterium]|nr:hypothetical protein [Bacteroidales bacterium]